MGGFAPGIAMPEGFFAVGLVGVQKPVDMASGVAGLDHGGSFGDMAFGPSLLVS